MFELKMFYSDSQGFLSPKDALRVFAIKHRIVFKSETPNLPLLILLLATNQVFSGLIFC